MVGVIVASAVKLERNMRVDSHRKIIVEYVDGLQNARRLRDFILKLFRLNGVMLHDNVISGLET